MFFLVSKKLSFRSKEQQKYVGYHLKWIYPEAATHSLGT